MLANARYWTSVAPLVRRELARWEQHAHTIEDPTLRSLAQQKLTEERFNSEVAATLATLAPKPHRERVVEAIVAYEVMYDYLDALTEQPTDDPLGNGHALYRAFTDAITPHATQTSDYYKLNEQRKDNGYLLALVSVVQQALAQLPSAPAIFDASQQAAARCAEAQIRAHAVPSLGTGQLEQWAQSEAADSALGWREYLAGSASCVLSVHALIAAAADPLTTAEEAAGIDGTYLSICSLSTMLDSLIDHDRDAQAGEAGYISYYQDHDLLARDLTRAARRAREHAGALKNGAHHEMTLAGVAAYYTSAPAAQSEFARPVTQSIRSELKPLITPTLAIMRAWRAAKRLRTLAASPGVPPPSPEDADGQSVAAARYVAVIADGNGRWAHARGLPIADGHNAGADNLKARIRDAAEFGIQELTVYFFSTENWARPPAEVQGLISLLEERIATETPGLHRHGVRMRFIGGRDGLPPCLLERMRWAEELTAANTRIVLCIAFNYGGRAEIIAAAKHFHGTTEEEFSNLLYAPDLHEPDLVIRTGGEQRLSNYLLWQTAHSELVFRDEYWPDFTRQALQQSLREFSIRKRTRG